jgi:hypothetical protein
MPGGDVLRRAIPPLEVHIVVRIASHRGTLVGWPADRERLAGDVTLLEGEVGERVLEVQRSCAPGSKRIGVARSCGESRLTTPSRIADSVTARSTTSLRV